MRPFLSRFAVFASLGSLAPLAPLASALLLGACSSSSGAAATDDAATGDDTGSIDDTSVEDTGAIDSGATPDTSPDTSPKDTGTPVDSAKSDAPQDTAPPGYDYGKSPIDESCYASGNSGQFGDLQASPDGKEIAFQRCDTARSIVVRDLSANTAAVIATGSGFFVAGANGVLAANGTATELTSWGTSPKLSIPVALASTDAWRVWQSPTALKYATKAASTTNPLSREKLVFYANDGATSVSSADYDATATSIASVVFSADGTKVASLERYPSELKSRLRVATPGAGAAVTTYELTLFEPRWVKGGQVGKGALLLSGMNGTQQASRLYFIDFETGALTQLSTTDVIPVMPPTASDVPAVAVRGDAVYFLTGAISSTGSSPVGKSVTVNKWSATTPATAPSVLATVSDAQIYALARYTSQKRSILVSADGTHLLLNLVVKAGTVFGNAWAAIPIGGGAVQIVASTSDIQVAAPDRVGVSNYMETDTKFLDVNAGTSVSMTRGNPLFSPDGATFFTSSAVQNADGKTYALTVRRKAGAAAESTIASLPKLDSNPSPLAVLPSSILLRLERGPAISGVETKYDLYLFP